VTDSGVIGRRWGGAREVIYGDPPKFKKGFSFSLGEKVAEGRRRMRGYFKHFEGPQHKSPSIV
jgi:hypothetical protein